MPTCSPDIKPETISLDSSATNSSTVGSLYELSQSVVIGRCISEIYAKVLQHMVPADFGPLIDFCFITDKVGFARYLINLRHGLLICSTNVALKKHLLSVQLRSGQMNIYRGCPTNENILKQNLPRVRIVLEHF